MYYFNLVGDFGGIVLFVLVFRFWEYWEFGRESGCVVRESGGKFGYLEFCNN